METYFIQQHLSVCNSLHVHDRHELDGDELATDAERHAAERFRNAMALSSTLLGAL